MQRICTFIAAATMLYLGSPVEAAAPPDGFDAMLQAISAIRSARDITLDCTAYVDRYIGHSDSIRHYLDVFAVAGIQSRETYNPPKHYTWFEIGAARLRKTPGSRFGRGDHLIIVFTTDGPGADAGVTACKAVLQAAVPYI